MYKIIVDANVWIRFARIKNIAPLLNRFTAYNLLPVTNNYLLSEVFGALVDNKWMNENKALNVAGFIKKITYHVIETATFRLSPDPKDNYLFDLAVQQNCIFIISDDSQLLQFILKPVRVYTSSWFLKAFPL